MIFQFSRQFNSTVKDYFLIVLFSLVSFTMTSPSAGIQQLLAAEKKAADKVGEARKRKKIQLFAKTFEIFVIM